MRVTDLKRYSRFSALLVFGSLLSFPNAPAYAHHSPSAFDQEHQVLVTGTVKRYLWGNPHVWIFFEVPNDKGGSDEWQIEGAALITLARMGWTSTTLAPGDKVSMVVSPRRDGTPGGRMHRVIFPDGRSL